MFSTKSLARLAGALYLIVAVAGGFSQYVRTSVTVPGDATATAAAIAQHAGLFRAAFAIDLVDFTAFLAVGLLLYAIVRSTNPAVALAMLVVNAVSVAIQALNMVTHLAALLIATDPTYTAGLSTQGAPGLVLLMMDLHQQGYVVAQIFFGGYLAPLGYLVYRSGLFPRLLGLVLAVGAAGYLAGVVATFVTADPGSALALVFGLVGGLAESVFLLWLLVRGAGARPASFVTRGLSWEA